MVTITVRIQTSDCFMVRPKPLFHQVAPQLPVRIPKWSPLFSLKPWSRHQYWCLWSDTHSEPAAVLWIRWKMSWNSGKMPFSVKVPLKFTLQGLFNAPIKKIVNFYKAWVEKKKKKKKRRTRSAHTHQSPALLLCSPMALFAKAICLQLC